VKALEGRSRGNTDRYTRSWRRREEEGGGGGGGGGEGGIGMRRREEGLVSCSAPIKSH